MAKPTNYCSFHSVYVAASNHVKEAASILLAKQRVIISSPSLLLSIRLILRMTSSATNTIWSSAKRRYSLVAPRVDCADFEYILKSRSYLPTLHRQLWFTRELKPCVQPPKCLPGSELDLCFSVQYIIKHQITLA